MNEFVLAVIFKVGLAWSSTLPLSYHRDYEDCARAREQVLELIEKNAIQLPVLSASLHEGTAFLVCAPIPGS